MAAAREPGAVRFLRHSDLALLVAALPVFVAARLPLLGYAAAAAGWIAQRAVRAALVQRAEGTRDPRTMAGLMTASMLGRAWLLALLIFGAGLIERRAGLAAAVLVILLFTAFFGAQLALRPFDREAPR